MTPHPSWDLPLRTRLLALALQRLRPSVSRTAPEDLPALRAWTRPPKPPYTWVTGPVYGDVERRDESFAARDGGTIPVRVYRPTLPGADPSIPSPDRLPVVVYFHGGGWVLGNLDGYDPICSFIAHEAQVLVVSVDYRLAPEHAAPTAVHDCVDAVRWVTAEADRLAAHAEGMGVAGDSAGGNLAAVVARVVRDEGGASIGHQALLYPGTDATMSHPSIDDHAHAPILTREDIRAFLGHYLGGSPEALLAHDPLVSPLHAEDLAGLPPALVQTADLDPLRDEGIAYAQRLTEAGVDVQLTNYPRAPHGFHSFPGGSPAGRPARQELATWIARHSRRPRVD